jgi:hypothetical protein
LGVPVAVGNFEGSSVQESPDLDNKMGTLQSHSVEP